MQRVNRPEGCLSDLALDELLAGELEVSARTSAEQHLASCERCAARHAELSAASTAFLTQAPTFTAHAQLASAAQPTARKRPTRLTRWAAGGAGALAMAAIVLLWLRGSGERIELPQTRSKGAPHLGLFIKRRGQAERVSSGAAVQAGDLLRFSYSSDRTRYLAIFDLDGGSASMYFPSDGSAQAPAIDAGSDVALDFSVEQDGSPAEEHVYGVFCAEPFALEPLRKALEQTGRVAAREGCVVDVLELRKSKVAP